MKSPGVKGAAFGDQIALDDIGHLRSVVVVGRQAGPGVHFQQEHRQAVLLAVRQLLHPHSGRGEVDPSALVLEQEGEILGKRNPSLGRGFGLRGNSREQPLLATGWGYLVRHVGQAHQGQRVDHVGKFRLLFGGGVGPPPLEARQLFALQAFGGVELGFQGFNVLSYAIQIPLSELEPEPYTAAFADLSEPLPAVAESTGVGVYASVSRRRITLRSDRRENRDFGSWVQVSRLGNPLFNEVLVPLKDKDKYNRTSPEDDVANSADYDSAYEHLQDALDARSDLSTLSRSSHLLWLTGDARKAKWLMQQAIDSAGPYPENTAWCRAELATMHLLTGALLPAAQEAEQALATAPRNPRVLVAMSRVRAAQERFEEAIEFARRSIVVRPTHDALSLLTDLYVITGQEDKATAQRAEVLAYHGSAHHHDHGGHSHYHADGNAQLAAFLARHGQDLPRALAEAEKAYALFPNLGAIDAYAWCLHLDGQSEKASRILRRALKWNCPDPVLAYHAAVISEALGDTTGARKRLAAALHASPRFDPLLAPRAHAFLKSLSPKTGSPPSQPE